MAVSAALHAARWVYYGEWFPNTYYLKLTGWSAADRLMPGVTSLFWAACQFALPAVAALWGVLDRPARWQAPLWVAVAATLAFQVYVGGDAWALNRFMVPIVPAMAVMAAHGVERGARGLLAIRSRRARHALHGAALAGIVVAQNAVFWPGAFLAGRVHLTIENVRSMQQQVVLQQALSPDAVVAVAFAGLVPYFGEWECVDLLGKCDRHVARLPVRKGRVRPGHNKQDILYSVNTRKPDVMINTLDPNLEGVNHLYSARRFLVDGDVVVFWVREGTSHFRGGGEAITLEEVKRCFLQ